MGSVQMTLINDLVECTRRSYLNRVTFSHLAALWCTVKWPCLNTCAAHHKSSPRSIMYCSSQGRGRNYSWQCQSVRYCSHVWHSHNDLKPYCSGIKKLLRTVADLRKLEEKKSVANFTNFSHLADQLIHRIDLDRKKHCKQVLTYTI